jgi:hypothetical protein
MMYLICWILLFLLSVLKRFSNKISALQEKLKEQLIWKQSINLLLSQFPPLFLSSVLNMHDLRFKDPQNVTKVSSYISVIAIIAVSIALLLMFFKVWRLTRNLSPQ